MSRRRISVPLAFTLAEALAVLVVWLIDPFEVVALAARALSRSGAASS